MEQIPLYDGQLSASLQPISCGKRARRAGGMTRQQPDTDSSSMSFKAVFCIFHVLPWLSSLFLLFQRVSHQSFLDCLCLPYCYVPHWCYH